jgi:Holliday junction resolvase RusA-like endonuclease
MNKVNIKPLSVNEAFQGRRFKTDKYKKYERDLLFLLPKIELPVPPYQVHFIFGLSNPLADYDNSIKNFQDILQKKYSFDDKDIYKAVIEKKVVKKGQEFIEFKIESLESNNFFIFQ